MNSTISSIAILTIGTIAYMVFIRKTIQNHTQCHPKTDNFDFWCIKEVGKGWGVRKTKESDDCDENKQKAMCGKSWHDGEKVKK